MKYIRTKDRIYEVVDSYRVNAGFMKYEVKSNYDHCILEEEIIKQADTIEELCDEFHIEYFSLDKTLSYVRFYDFEIAKQNNEDNDEIYGVIHIKGKGLIYVAKMNDKGELELL